MQTVNSEGQKHGIIRNGVSLIAARPHEALVVERLIALRAEDALALVLHVIP